MMEYRLLIFVILSTVLTVNCGVLKPNDTANIPQKPKEESRSQTNLYVQILSCASSRDLRCFLDTAESYLDQHKSAILAQADLEAARNKGRAEAASPSNLTKMIGNLLSQITDMFRDGLDGFFRSGKDGEDELDEKDEKTAVEGSNSTTKVARTAGAESRGKKKKKHGKIKRLIKLIKLLIIGAVIAVKLGLLLKLFTAALQFKFLLVAIAALAINGARFYFDLKKNKQPQKVIYYEHAQHQHHYEHDGGDEHGGDYWGRSIEEEDGGAKYGQDLAYSQQSPSSSW